MKRLLLFAALCAVIPLSAWSQTATVQGRVLSGTDSTALVGTTVVLVGNLQVNAMSGADGKFELKGVPHGTRNLQFVYLGYEHKTMPVIVKGTRVDMGSIYLAESANTIDAVVVKASAPMAIMRNDTVQYNAEAFKTNPDADADELITKMPGVVIQNGKIEAQGEPVRRIYVDGKLFFGTDPMAALKSLPADAVESIQLFDAPSEESRMTGFDDGNTEKAINIVTKTKQRESTIVKAEMGGGADLRAHDRDFRYLTGGNFSRFTERQRFTLSLLSNNVNTQRFGDPELNGDAELDANGNVRNQPQGVQNINGAGVNYVYDEGKKIKIESSYFFDRTRNHTIRHTENNFYPTESIDQKSSMSDDEYITTRITNRANLRLEYRPSKSDHIVFTPRLTASKTDTDPRGAYSLNVQDNAPIQQTRTFSDPHSLNLSFGGDLLWTHRFAKRGRSLTLSFNYSQSEYNYDQHQTDSLRQKWINGVPTDVNPANWTNRYITTDTYTNSIRGRVLWAEPIATYHRILANYTYRREWSDYDKLSNKYSTATGDYTIEEANQTNVYDRDYTTNSLGLGYGLYARIFTLTAEMEYMRADQVRIEQQPTQANTRLTFYSWQPNVSLKYTIQKKRYLRLRYSGRTVLPNIAYMQDVLNTNSRMNLRYGNPDLT
ncbi:MAG: outer membrane beta-barrel protein, partial [Rikenellaceae bacterium]|nr:outer membrane beta-barrel protein [Rikenellaceae bacterium]